MQKSRAGWKVLHLIPIEPRGLAAVYYPLGVKNLCAAMGRRLLGQSGKDCYDAIVKSVVKKLGRLVQPEYEMLGDASAIASAIRFYASGL